MAHHPTDTPADSPGSPESPESSSSELHRRRFLGYLIAAPTLAVGVPLTGALLDPGTASASVPTLPQPEELFDLGDAQDYAAAPTSALIVVQVNNDGTASFALHRTEVGQGITTTFAMVVAEELDLPLNKVHITLADARPELVMNQLTGGSNAVRSCYVPVRTAAALARLRLRLAAAKLWGVPVDEVTTSDGVLHHASGRSASYGSLAEAAAVIETTVASVLLKPSSQFTVLGKPTNRIDAPDIVTGRKKFGMDMQVPGALPAMVRRPPTLNGTVRSVNNLAAVKKMPGVTDVAAITYGVAVRAQTFGQCIDALRALDVTWGPGTVDNESDDTVLAKLRAAQLPMTAPQLGALSIDSEFIFHFGSNSPLEPDNAIADVRPDSAEIWSALKVPITAQEQIALELGLPLNKVKVHVLNGGGSFGRHLFHNVASEAAEFSKKIGKPVKLQWSRTDDFRQGRAHSMATSRIRATYLLGNVLTFEQRHTSVQTDYSHGLGEILTTTAARLPGGGNLSFAETIFLTTQSVPYNFGVVTQLLNEVPLRFNTGAMRNVYSPNSTTAIELMVDQLAKKLGQDPAAFRRSFLRDDRLRAVLDKAVQVGQWGKSMPAGTAQGIALHAEYRAAVCTLVEIDCRPATVNRPIEHGVTGPRVTRVTLVVDPGIALNPKGLEAQMMGGINDAIASTLTASLHMRNGIPLEGSWDDYFYTRQWNTPPQVQVVIMPKTSDNPSGAGELGVAPTAAAVACAYARATGTLPTTFPINHGTLSFEPFPLEPSTPQSPTNGLDHTF